MARFTRIQVIQKMNETGMVPLFFHSDLEIAKNILNACYKGGARLMEFTSRGDYAHEIFGELSKYAMDKLPEMILGVGSITDASQASLYMSLGSNFIVTPVLRRDIAIVCNRRKVLWSAGCGTLTEIADAEELDEPRGALVVSVAENSPSDKAGIKDGDIILEFNGEKIKQMKELPAIVAKTEVGKNVKVKVWRNKNELTKNVILGRLETSEDFNIGKKQEPVNKQTSKIESLKITVRVLTKDDIKNRKLPNQTSGLVVTKIENNSPVAKSLEVNSIITHAQKKKIRSINDLIKITEDVLNSNQKTILLAIFNNQNQRRYIGVNLD